MNKTKILIMIVLIIIVAVTMLLLFSNKAEEKYDFNIHFFDAGKADAILLSYNNKYIMIDTGEKTLASTVLDYFNKNEITKLDYLIITHFDKDHVGSASDIIDNIEIGEVLQSNYPKDSEYYNSYVESLDNKGINANTIESNYNFDLDDLKVLVEGPNKVYDKNESNNSSLIVSVYYKDTSYLFMGDCENARLKDYNDSHDKTYNFIKIPYHGRYLKRLDKLLDIVKPRYAVMTCSSDEGCEDKTINVLNQYRVKYYMTKDGSIDISSDGKNIRGEINEN